ncbi:UNVERIFIED_CONTAM: hypothetical protein FKN15_040851 [Acipenser sinensis]
MQHSPDGLLGHYSPSHDGPLYCTSPRRSPAKAFSASQSSRAFFPNSDEQDLPKAGKYLKRYTEEEGSRVYLHERGNGREKDAQKDRVQEKGRAERDGEWAEQGGLDLGGKKAGEKVPFLGDSPEVEEEDESQAYRQPYQFKVTSQVEQVKSYAVESRWNLDSQEESGKYKIKTFSKGERDYDRFGEDRTYKFKDTSYVVDRLGVNKGKYAEEGKSAEKFDEKITIKRDTVSPQQLRAEKLRELYEHGGLLQKTVDVRDKALLRDESLPRVKMVTNEACRPEVKVVYDDPSPGTSVASDRSLASALVHSVKREQGFRSIFDHIKRPQTYKNSAESFIQHIVSLVHHVTEHYFKSTGMTLHERFTVHQKAAEGHEARPKSPEIHRRINISPSVFKKERIIKEEGHKGEKKSRCDSADLRHDIDRRRKERSQERDDLRGSREPSPSRKLDKLGKEFKDYKDYKSYKDESKHKSKERDRSRSSSSSCVSQEDKDSRKERDEEYKSHHEQKDDTGYQGGNRARGTFQFRIRGGRGRGRGVFSGQNAAPSIPNVPFQKRPKEEEWDPEYTPKSKKYFLRGRGRFSFKKSSSSPKWTHDKYRCEGNVEEDEEEVENEQRKDKRKDEKIYMHSTAQSTPVSRPFVPSFADVLWVADSKDETCASLRGERRTNCIPVPPEHISMLSQSMKRMVEKKGNSQTTNTCALKKITALEDELSRLRAQIAMIVTTQDQGSSMSQSGFMQPPGTPGMSLLPMLTSTPSSTPAPPPPPPPPPPPSTSLPPPSCITAQVSAIDLIRQRRATNTSGQCNRDNVSIPDSPVPSMLDVLKEMNKVRLRAVERSPGGTPVMKDKKRVSLSDPAALIADALKRKFAHRHKEDSFDKENRSFETSPFGSPETHRVCVSLTKIAFTC